MESFTGFQIAPGCLPGWLPIATQHHPPAEASPSPCLLAAIRDYHKGFEEAGKAGCQSETEAQALPPEAPLQGCADDAVGMIESVRQSLSKLPHHILHSPAKPAAKSSQGQSEKVIQPSETSQVCSL
ncbi:hypothetical protein WJX73_005430 [Symbiochloris irregularis]|uniref:Uncharacterized protein n=1 Tax=Symbiochloris irregularis TaxID=706552 RepID=A0AAW1PRS6_9CHLO